MKKRSPSASRGLDLHPEKPPEEELTVYRDDGENSDTCPKIRLNLAFRNYG